MHIPDGFLSAPVWAAMWIATIVIMGYAVMRTNRKLGEKHIPMMGVLAAFIFAGQMLNTPVAGGTSGHMLGGVLSASILGPLAASVIMATVFIVQAIFFQDGGITTLGANIFNMGFIGTIFGYYVYRSVSGAIGGQRGRYIGLGVAAWLAVVLASAACAIELAASGTVPLNVALPAMVGIHSIVGLIEAGITIAAVSYIMKTRPDLLELEKI
ncbi:MAG: cobalamin biosynthesis protein CbiM [Candidatus Altiarchaeales archaeon IMC4]|nr:MAG: cobalamin biosynthesis protein CbiM [Candidatus Altiarchaeales archaeon IMC4]